MMDHRDWEDFTEADSLDAHLCGTLPAALKEEIRSRLTDFPQNPAERLALLWALDHFIPFHHFRQHGYPWTLVSYEALLADGSEELERVFNELNASVPEAAYNRLTTASGSASGDLQVRNTYRQLSKWTRKLDANQTEDILQIVEAFDLDFYTEAVEPDYQQLLRYQSEASRER